MVRLWLVKWCGCGLFLSSELSLNVHFRKNVFGMTNNPTYSYSSLKYETYAHVIHVILYFPIWVNSRILQQGSVYMIPVRHSSHYKMKTLYCLYINRFYAWVSFILEENG